MSKKRRVAGMSMRIGDIEKIIENKYSLLLFFLITLSVISIVTVDNILLHFTVESVLSLVVFIIMLKILKAPRGLFSLFLALVFLALFFHCLAIFFLESRSIGIITMLAYIFMLLVLITFMVRRIFSERMVTGDTIKGGISVYLLISVLWQFIYVLLWTLNPKAFKCIAGEIGKTDFFYFSITTMTTLGYGDIIPVTYPAKVFSMLQALTGQIYIAVFVARLVGLHVAGHSSKK